MGKFRTLGMRLCGERDFKISRKGVVVRNRRVVPDSLITIKLEEVDGETGEVTENMVEVTQTLTRDVIEDSRGFVKHRRFRSLMGLSGQTLRLYCYMLEAMDQWGNVEMDYYDIEEYVGTRCHAQLSRSIGILLDKSLIKRRPGKGGVRARYGLYSVEGVSRRKEERNDKKLGRFVKVYNPAVISALSKGGLMLLCYVMDRCGYDGVVELRCQDFLKYTQDWLGAKGLHCEKCFYDARKDLLSDKINILKPLYDVVERDDGGFGVGCVSGWYRISPNVCFVGNRAEAGYEVEG